MTRAIRIALIAGALALVGVAPASAESIVFIRDANVWLANADATGQYQVTLDGTTASPYESPSQADDGTILAVREVPGGRRELFRMRQNGELLNAPAKTPAPGTGAIDAQISPDGKIAAYWFITLVNDPFCAFCTNIASRALYSYSDRFTNYDDIRGPQTGTEPSWIDNDTVLLSNGNATQWYHDLGTVEAKQWWADSDNNGGGSIVNLGDSEATRTGDRIAVVRGRQRGDDPAVRVQRAPAGDSDDGMRLRQCRPVAASMARRGRGMGRRSPGRRPTASGSRASRASRTARATRAPC